MESPSQKLDPGPEQNVEGSVERRRADTLGSTNPYLLKLTEDELRELHAALGGDSLHSALGFLCGALTIPEPLSWQDVIEHYTPGTADELDSQPLDDDELGGAENGDQREELRDEERVSSLSLEHEQLLRTLFDQVQQRIAEGEVASLIPAAQDARACDDWIDGLDAAACQTLHDLTEEESEVCETIFPRPFHREGAAHTAARVAARQSLAGNVTKLMQLWSEVPPYDPEQDELHRSRVVPKERPELPSEKVLHTGGTFIRSEAKVGRNDPCPCGSGKKYKKCCG